MSGNIENKKNDFFDDNENINDFLERERKTRILSICIGLLLGTLGGLRFYQKKYCSAVVMFILFLFTCLSLNGIFFEVLSILIRLSLFFVVFYDLFNVFKDYDRRRLEKLNKLRENA